MIQITLSQLQLRARIAQLLSKDLADIPDTIEGIGVAFPSHKWRLDISFSEDGVTACATTWPNTAEDVRQITVRHGAEITARLGLWLEIIASDLAEKAEAEKAERELFRILPAIDDPWLIEAVKRVGARSEWKGRDSVESQAQIELFFFRDADRSRIRAALDMVKIQYQTLGVHKALLEVATLLGVADPPVEVVQE